MKKLLFVGLLSVLLVTSVHAQKALNDASGTITAGGTSQQVIASRTTETTYILFQNISADTLWLNFGVAAVADQPSIKVLAGGSVVWENNYTPSTAMNVIGPNTGAKFVCKWK